MDSGKGEGSSYLFLLVCDFLLYEFWNSADLFDCLVVLYGIGLGMNEAFEMDRMIDSMSDFGDSVETGLDWI